MGIQVTIIATRNQFVNPIIMNTFTMRLFTIMCIGLIFITGILMIDGRSNRDGSTDLCIHSGSSGDGCCCPSRQPLLSLWESSQSRSEEFADAAAIHLKEIVNIPLNLNGVIQQRDKSDTDPCSYCFDSLTLGGGGFE